MRAVARKLSELLTLQEQRRLALVLGIAVLHALVEVVGIASIVPFLTLVCRGSIALARNGFIGI